MNSLNNNISTPKQTKRLGLRRTSSILKRASAINDSSAGEKRSNDNEETPQSSRASKKPQSDRKINYKKLEGKVQKATDHVTNTLATPSRNQTREDLVRQQSVSTNCRPYRLSLSKKVREKMTKKRLEFHMANEIDKDESEEDQDPNDELTREQLIREIEMAREELKARLEHVKKVEELKQAINVWQTGFSVALEDLQQIGEPRLELPQLLERLHIPQEMLKYIKD